MKSDKNKDETEKEELKKIIIHLRTEKEVNIETIPNDLVDKIKAVKREHLPLLKGFKLVHKGIPSGACLTFCAGVQFHDDENQGPNVKMEVNNQISDKFEEFYINELGLPYTETVGVGEARFDITLETVEEAKSFFKDPKSGSLDVYSNQAEMKAITNLYNTNIHIFTFGEPNCEPKWTSIGPDASLFSEAQFPKSATTDMYLYHEYDNHFDLLVDNEKIKRLAEVKVNEPKKETTKNFTNDVTDKPTNDTKKEPSKKMAKSEAWTKVKKSTGNKSNSSRTEDAKPEEDFLSDSQKVGEVIHRSKVKGYKRAGPMVEATKHTDKEDTLCHICQLRCTTNIKLRTHMKSHTKEETYDMSSLQDAIKTSKETSVHTHDRKQMLNIVCNKCEETFKDKYELRNHIRVKHPSFKPCKNYKGPNAENSCEFGSKCDYSHILVEDGTYICWECGHLFSRRGELMSHRKQTHGASVICRKMSELGGCDRTNEQCWYSHNKPKEQTPKTTEQDFPKLSQNKETPIEIDNVKEQPKKNVSVQAPIVLQAEPQKVPQKLPQATSTTLKQGQNPNLMIEIMKMIQQQNIMLVNMMTKMNQN